MCNGDRFYAAGRYRSRAKRKAAERRLALSGVGNPGPSTREPAVRGAVIVDGFDIQCGDFAVSGEGGDGDGDGGGD